MADRIGLFNTTGSSFFLRNDFAGGNADTTFAFGPAPSTFTSLTGDWDGVGADGVGLYDAATGSFFLSNGLTQATVNTGVTSLQFGPAGAGLIPLVGDWDGNGTDTVGLYRASDGAFFLSNGTTQATVNTGVSSFNFGPAGAGLIPLVGDWDSNGTDTVGLYRVSDGAFFLSNGSTQATVNTGVTSFLFGAGGAGLTPLVGDWDGNGSDTVGLYNTSGGFFISNGATQATVNTGVQSFNFGPGGAGWNPLVGEWVAPAPTFTLTSAAASINEGSALAFTVTLSAAQSTATTVTFQLKAGDAAAANQGTTNTNLNDFTSGAFTVVTVTIPAGSTTATFNVTPASDGLTELTEAFSVDATIAGVTKSLGATVLDGAISGGQTFALTNSTITGKGDDLIGTSGNDTFLATTVGTLETGDKLDGGAGTDTLQANLGAAAPLTVVPIVTNIENWNIGTTTGFADTVELSASSGYKELTFAGALDATGAGDLVFNNIATATDLTLGMQNVAGTTGTANLLTGTFTAAAVAGASDTVRVALNTVGQNDSTGAGGTFAPAVLINPASGVNGVENLAVHVTGGAARLSRLASESATATSVLKSITITGDKNLDVGIDAAGGTAIDFASSGTVNAAAFTGALNLNLASADNITVTGGTGNDRLAFGGTLNATDSVDGGAGTDTLAANLFSDVVAAVGASRISNIEAIELQAVPGTAATLDTSKAGNVTALTFGAGTGTVQSTVNNMASGATVSIEAATGGAGGVAQINIKDANLAANTSDVLNLNFGTATTAAEFAVGNINTAAATGVETIKVAALGSSVISGTGVAYTATIGNDASLKTIEVSGNGDVALTYAGASLTTYDASTANGSQTTTAGMFSTSGATIKGGSKADGLTGSTGNDTIDGGAGSDVITGGLGSDRITTGTGSDTVILSANTAVPQANVENGVVDLVTDFTLGSGGDVLDATVTRVQQSGTKNVATVSSLTGSLPAVTTPTTNRAEIVVLDSSVTALQASNGKAISEKAFNLGATDYLGQNIIVAYAPNATSDVRLAYATVANVGGSIKLTNVVDMAVLQNITTATLATGFNAANLTGLPTALLATAAAFNTNTGANIQGGQTINAAADNTISTTGAFLVGSTAQGSATVGTTDVLQISDNVAVALSAAASLTNLERIDLQVAHNGLTMDVVNANVRGSAGGDTVIIANNGAMTFDGVNGGADVVVIGVAAPTATLNNLGADDTIRGLVANNVASIAGVNAGAVTGAGTLDLLTNAAAYTYTMTAAQHNGFTAINAAGGNDNLVLTTAGNIVGDADIQGYSVVEGSTFTMGSLGQNVTETGAVGTVSTVIFGAGIYNGAFTTFDATDVARVVNGTDLSGISGASAGTIDFQNLTGTLTLSHTQNAAAPTFINAGTGAQTITVVGGTTGFTTNALIENYNVVGGTTVTLGAAHTGVNITGSSVAAATTVNIGGQTVTGTYNLQDTGTADVLVASTGADIKSVNGGAATTAEALTLNSVGVVMTMTGAQLQGFTGTITGVGTDTINISTQSTGANAVTLTTAENALDTVAFQSTAADTIAVTNVGAGASYTGTIDLTAAGGADIVRINNTYTALDNLSEVTISNFSLAGVGVDKLQIFSGATAISDGTFQAITVAGTAATGEVIAINSGALANAAALQGTTNNGAVETAIMAAVGNIATGDYTFVLYGDNDAGVYQVNVTAANITAAGDFSVELLGIVSGVGPFSMTNVNFA